MKLIFCPSCHDLFRLLIERRQCKCGLIEGRYLDSTYAIVSPQAINLGLGNGSLQKALSEIRNGADRADVMCWVRTTEFSVNPHTEVAESDDPRWTTPFRW